jgi:hypothetical protein
MINTSPEQIVRWFKLSKLGINAQPQKHEVNTECPFCGHPAFYFNVSKQVGKCHRASCGRTPTLEDLVGEVGYGPDEDEIYRPSISRGGEAQGPEPLTLEAPPLITFDTIKDEYSIWNAKAWEYLGGRSLSLAHVIRHDIRWDGKRIIVPVKGEDGCVYQYVGRLVEGEGLRYKYASGVNIQQFIFGWSEAKLWPRLSLVENTFNASAWRESFYCSTNFGSNLSAQQIAMIKNSHAQSVALLWDEGAESNALKGVRSLTKVGVPAAYCQIIGQPDDHPLAKLVEWNEDTHEAALKGEPFIDRRNT